jgi:hypothetical protein
MSAFTYLPGFIANTVDGGMATPVTHATKKTLVLGTAGQGPANVAYPVNDPTQAAADFGLAGRPHPGYGRGAHLLRQHRPVPPGDQGGHAEWSRAGHHSGRDCAGLQHRSGWRF